MMQEHRFLTSMGPIHYWTSPRIPDAPTLVFLPGLGSTHYMFSRQIAWFMKHGVNCLVWDAPSHGVSRPFDLQWSIDDTARWLHTILQQEHITEPVLVGQSMGGFTAQAMIRLYPGEVRAFVGIDSAPLERQYYSNMDLKIMHLQRVFYRFVPRWFRLFAGPYGVSTTKYGRSVARFMLFEYTHPQFVHLMGHGYDTIAHAIKADNRYALTCPTLLLCGDMDLADAAQRLNRQWSETEHLQLHWIPSAGHNSNTDQPDLTNELITNFLDDQCGIHLK
ncbi:alpha/beta hydrolase [Bifidobacterium dolichotidis]|uniref:Alpha/beta hydrolase n=1 Tax=Bifidobacterium dolichotidis TaxID=2306976 RepID=A0A430FRK9_9BIFI|nr:alpha/beta hydrolase [Bifidobacterium dolichotidis]RSX55509.1 alpha/beta hydrolase [Bifidobacterium dolichotidis]